MTTERARQLAAEVLTVIMRHQRRDRGAPCSSRPCPVCIDVHTAQVAHFIANDEPIQFVLPGFPCKSPNTVKKVIGNVPDMAERLSLSFLNRVCRDIQAIYRPGAQITICADGHVFVESIAANDSTISNYQHELRRLVNDLGANHLRLFNLNDHYTDGSFDTMRTRLVEEYGEDLDELHDTVKNDAQLTALYRSFTRFLFEDSDMPGYDGCGTRAALQRRSRARAYLLLMRSRAWGSLVGDVFPNAVRLSIHPQPCGSTKLGMNLLASQEDNWITPWHSTAVEVNGQFKLMKRETARSLGAQIATVDGKPSHYVLHDAPAVRGDVSELAVPRR